jgi:eukaryotic translation initiation factor 2C
MTGPTKRRAKAEKKPEGSSNGSSSAFRDPTQRSEPKSMPFLDGNRVRRKPYIYVRHY